MKINEAKRNIVDKEYMNMKSNIPSDPINLVRVHNVKILVHVHDICRVIISAFLLLE